MPLGWAGRQWWRALKVKHKVWTVLLLLCVPLIGGLTTHLYIVQQLLAIQQQRHELALAHEHVQVLRRLAIDIEDGFRGYALTQQPAFLAPLTEAEAKIDQALANAAEALAEVPGHPTSLAPIEIEQQLKDLLRSKHQLIAAIQQGSADKALAYVRSGEGLRLSDRLRQDFRTIEDRLERQRESYSAKAEALSQQTFFGLWIALAGVVALGWIGSRMLARSVTEPVMQLHAATVTLGKYIEIEQVKAALMRTIQSGDEFGRLAGAYLDMARRIGIHIRELEALNTIGNEINTIGPDGLDGVLRRITDRAVELVQANVCLVLLRNEQMGCWIVEAASGKWDEQLKKSVMLWEELPVCVQAYEGGQPTFGERFRNDRRPQVVRRNLIGDSMLAVPLLAHGKPFGVLALISEGHRVQGDWNKRLAVGMAQEAAVALANAHLYEAAQQKQRGLAARLRQLEHLAETLAHDLKGPGSRMEELAKLVRQKLAGQADERTVRWLQLIEENGADIVQRVEGILSVARVGAGQGSVTAVDPRLVIDDVLKAWAGEIERLRATIQVEPGFPLVACHGAYLRQIFDNLLSNALKYARPGEPPALTISAQTGKHMVCFSVCDRGIGIPADHRSRVFQPFVRLGQAEAPGSGIGLAIVQRIVTLYGGQVWIEGAEGEGCTVKFTVPWLMEEGHAGCPGGRGPGVPEEIVEMPAKEIV
jgi:signal transduction histidine kinase/CHASE3 domain sensor protein